MVASGQGQDYFSGKLEGRVYSDDGDVAAIPRRYPWPIGDLGVYAEEKHDVSRE